MSTKLTDDQRSLNRKESMKHILDTSKPTVQIAVHYQSLDRNDKENLELYKKIYQLAVSMEQKLKEENIIPCELPKADGTIKQSDIFCGIQYLEKKNAIGMKDTEIDKEHTLVIAFRNGGEMLSYLFDKELQLQNITYCFNSYTKLEETKPLAEYLYDARMKDSLKIVYDYFDTYKKDYENKVSDATVRKVHKAFQKLLTLDRHNKDGKITLSDITYTDKGYKFSLIADSMPKSSYDFYMKEGKVDRIDYRQEDVPNKYVGFHNTTLDFYARELADLDVKRSFHADMIAQKKTTTPFDLEEDKSDEDIER